MNPATSSSLDPKLKEVYDRVMGTSVGSTAPKPQAHIPATPPANNPTPASHPGNGNLTAQATPPSANMPHLNSPAGSNVPVQPLNKTVPPPRPASLAGAPQPKSAVDYAALAAKYATPPNVPAPEASPPPPPPPEKHAAVTPSSTTYGVVNGGSEEKTASHQEPENKGSAIKKLTIVAGILMFFVIYTFVWIVIFGFELPLPI